MSPAVRSAANYHRWIMELTSAYIAGKDTAEIGPGYGQYTPEYVKIARRLTVIDFDARILQQLQADVPGLSACVQVDISAPVLPDALADKQYEALVCLNVLEHIPNDALAIANFSRLLLPGGHLILQVPAHAMLFGRMDVLAGHHRRYSIKDVRRLLTPDLWDIRKCGYINPVGGIGWFMQARFNKSISSLAEEKVNRQILFFDRYMLPVSKMLTPLFSLFFGQSIFFVCRKKER